MKNKLMFIALLIVQTFVGNSQSILQEGGKKLSGTVSGQVPKWNGSAWVPGTDNTGADDQTFGKGAYASPTFSGKTITDAVFRRGKLSLFTSDTTGKFTIYHNDTLSTDPFIQLNGNGEVALSIKADTRATIGTNVNLVRKYGSSGDGNQNNQIVSLGINNTAGGGRENDSYPAIRYAIEENFRNGPTNFNAFECHLPDIYYTNGVNRRPLSGYFSRSGVNPSGYWGLSQDYIIFQDYRNNAQKATWSFRSPSPYALGIRFLDSSGVYLGKNNYAGFYQRRADGNADVKIAYVNSANEVVLGQENAINVTAYNRLKVSNGGVIFNEGNEIYIGDATNPTRLIVQSNDGIGFTLKKIGNAYSATHGLFNQQYYFLCPETGSTPVRFDMTAPEYAFWLRATDGRLGLGEPNPTAKLHLNATSAKTTSMIALTNPSGTSNIFRSDATPESSITGSPGDLAISGTGELYGKVSGTNTNTGWGKFLNLKDANSATNGQVLKWNGTAWAPSTVGSSGADSTWAKGTYQSPSYSPKNLLSNVHRRAKVSILTDDTTATLNLKPRYLRAWTEKKIAPSRSTFWGNPAYADGSAFDVQLIDINPMKANHFPSWNFGRWRDQIFTDSLTNLANGRAGNSIRNVGFNMDNDNTAMPRWYFSTEQHYTFPGNPREYWEHHLEVFDTLGRSNRPFNLNGSYNGNEYGAGFRVSDFYVGDPRASDYRLRIINGVTTVYNSLGVGGVTTPYTKLDVNGDMNVWNGSGAALYLSDVNFQNPSFYNKAPGLKAIYNAGQGVAADLGLYAYNGNRNLVAIASSNGNFGVGNSDPTDKLHVTGSARITGALKDGNNEAGTSGQFLSTTGTGTDWITVNQEATSIGTFQTTGTANGLSQFGTEIRLNGATGTTPGAVSLADGQVLGDGGKVLQSNLNGETTVLTLRNNAAAGADAGPGLQFQAGASNTPIMQIQSNLVGSTASLGAQTYFLNRGSNNGLNTHLTFGSNRISAANGLWRKETKEVTANYNVTSSFNNRFGHYCITAAGITLTMPLETDMADGVEVVVSNLTTSGADATVNTSAAYSEFMFDYDLDPGTGGNQFFAASLTVSPGKSYLLTSVAISGVRYWRVSLQASSAASYAIGTFQTTGTANAASILGTDIRIHAASGTTPGAVDLNDQILGNNTKILQKSNAAGISTPLILRNPTADGDDDGAGLTIQAGASNTATAAIESRVTGGAISAGTSLEIYNRNTDNVLRQALAIDQNNTTIVQGWLGGSVGLVGTSLDVSAGLSNRKSNLQFDAAGGSLTLPVTNVAEGTVVNINSTYESGANSTINTGAAYSEFAYDTDQDAGTGGNQFYTASISVAPMQSLTLKAMNISGQLRWKVLSSGGGGGGGSSTTTLDDAYNNFGATASKIAVDAAQGQTQGLEIETSGANDFTVDLQGTGDFKIQDAGTDVFRVFDNGRASFGNIAPNTSQRLVVAEDGASTVGTPIRADNGATVVDNGGTQIALAYNGFDRLNLKAYNPSGSYLNAASIETTSGANITITDDIRETRFNAAIAREITTGTATTYQVDGRTSFIRIPSSATTTTINLPEIVNGAATTNQVNVGYELYFSINRSVAVTINRAGSDVFFIDGVSGTSNSLQTTANVVFAKKLIASGLDEWTVVQ